MQKISLFHQKQKVICLEILGAFLVSPVVGCNFTRELAVSMEKKNWYRGLYKTLRAARTRWPTCGSFLHPTLVTRQLLRMVESTRGSPLPHLLLLSLSLAAAHHPPRPLRLPRFPWCSCTAAQTPGERIFLRALISAIRGGILQPACFDSSFMQCIPWMHCCCFFLYTRAV